MERPDNTFRFTFLLILLLAGCVSSPAATNEPQPAAVTATIANPTASSTASTAATAIPTKPPTLTATPAPATPTIAPQPTATPVPVADTLVLYAKIVAMQTSPDPDDLWERFNAFRTLPVLPALDPAIFDAFYGKNVNMEPIDNFFFDFRPHLSPDGRTLLVPGLAAYPEYDVEGTGTWLIDLESGEPRQLLPDGVIATWSPASDAITYVKDGTLYTLGIAEGATPNPLLQDENLWSIYAKWSPDGRTIATLISANPEPIDYQNPQFFAAPWLVPVNGDTARQLPVIEVFGTEYVTDQMSWSPDGQYLLVHNKVFDLDGNLISPDYQAGVHWLPDDTRLLANGQGGLRIIDIAGEELAHISDTFAGEWAFSHDGRQLAYSQGDPDGPWSLSVYDLEQGTSRMIAPHSASPVRWSADDSLLILGTFGDEHVERSQITTVSATGVGEETLLLDYAQLIEAVPYPPASSR